MKTIKNIIALWAMSILWIFSSMNYSYARDYIDWGNLEVKYTYDYNDEELDVRVYVEEWSSPDDRYTARFKLDGETYNRDFTYDSSKDELYFEYSINMDNDDLEDNYDMDIRVTNESRDEFEYEDVLSGDVGNVMDWNDLEVSSEYNSSSQYLRVELTLENIDESPNETYYSYLKLDGKTHTAAFRYSSSDDKYYATHTIYIDRDDIEDDYNYDLSIKSRNYRIVYEDDGTLEVDGDTYYSSNNTSKKDKFEWEDMTMNNYYNTSSKELNVVFMIPNVNKNPSKNYFVVLVFNGREYTKKLTYLDSQDKLYASLTFSLGSVKDYYIVDYSIISSSSTVFERENARMNINKPGVSQTTSNSYTIQKYNTDDIAQRIIDIAEERYTYSEDKIYYLERVSNKLENFFGTQPKYKAVLTGVNSRLKEQINSYEQTKYYEDDLFDLKYIDFR